MPTRKRYSQLAAKSPDVKLFCRIAKENGTTLSLKDAILLASLDMTEDELESEWKECDSLSATYEIISGRIQERRTWQDNEPLSVAEDHRERLTRARTNIFFAKKFAEWLRDDKLKLIAISGSTSYLSVSREDDLDLFIVTKRDCMWSCLVKALFLARMFRIVTRDAPSLCLSYVSDENHAITQFGNHQDALFARDAISTTVVKGESYFHHLLGKARWMAEYFPKMYGSRQTENRELPTDSKAATYFERITNRFLCYTAGTYITLKSYLLNRKFSKFGKKNSAFRVKIGRDHCVYESTAYIKLRKMYGELKEDTTRIGQVLT